MRDIAVVLALAGFAAISACGTTQTQPRRSVDRPPELPPRIIPEAAPPGDVRPQDAVIVEAIKSHDIADAPAEAREPDDVAGAPAQTPEAGDMVDAPTETAVPVAPVLDMVPVSPTPKTEPGSDMTVDGVCKKIAAKLAGVTLDDCLGIGLSMSDGRSRNGIPILQKVYPPKTGVVTLGRVLLLGGTHGDELTSVTSVFHWMRTLDVHHSGKFHWLVAPLVNPDGMLREQPIRGNAYGVDLNRNLPTPEWETRSREYWISTGRNYRRFPGPRAASEPETRWLMRVIDTFKPDVIVSVHAPLKHVDYDSSDRSLSPSRIGILYRQLMGVFPGSLGNYAGVQRDIPVITLEMPHLWVMEAPEVTDLIWTDLVFWLNRHVPELPERRLARMSLEQ